jgi:putative transposase
MCTLLGVSESGYHAWARRPPSDRVLSDAWLLEKIKQIPAENRQVYGSPRVHAEQRMAHGVRVSRKRVERLMRQAGISESRRLIWPHCRRLKWPHLCLI